MKIDKKNYAFVTVDSHGPINALGGISGPIINPVWVHKDTVIRLVRQHKKVNVVNPNNVSEKVMLNAVTAKNCTNMFPEPVKVAKLHEAPKIVKKPEKVKKEEVVETAPVQESGDFTKK